MHASAVTLNLKATLGTDTRAVLWSHKWKSCQICKLKIHFVNRPFTISRTSWQRSLEVAELCGRICVLEAWAIACSHNVWFRGTRQQIPGIDPPKQKTQVLCRTGSSCVMSCCLRSIETTARRGSHICALLYLFESGIWITKRHRVPHPQNYRKCSMLVLCCRLLLCIRLLIQASRISLVSKVVCRRLPLPRAPWPAPHNILVLDCFARFKTHHDLLNWCRL